MRPILKNNKLSKKTVVIYIIILLICIIGIGIALYISYFKNEKVGLPFGFTDKEAEKEDQYNELKLEFDSLFSNKLEILQEGTLNLTKINTNYDYILTAFNENKEEENISLNVNIPYININNNEAKLFNKKIKEKYKDKLDELKLQNNGINIIYTVDYVAYIQNNILSLAIRSGYKEGVKDQKVIVDTFNFNLIENKPVSVNEVLAQKNINNQDAVNKIRNEVKKIQEQNQPLIDEGYNFYNRDYNSNIYNISNNTQFLYGKNGMLYIIFAYGNEVDTTEMDVIIFQ